MFVTPAAVVVLPLAIAATFRREWALGLLAASVPFFSLTVVEVFSHSFPPHEIALLALVVRQVRDSAVKRRITIGNGREFILAIIFAIICVLSVLFAFINPMNVLVHPYNSGGFGAYEFKQFSFTAANFTQLLLRLFFIGGIFIIADAIEDTSEIYRLVRWTVFGAVLAGFVGVLYQLSVLTNVPLPEFLAWLGFGRFPTSPATVGGLPRMFSLPGEPGFTADYILYALAIAVTVFFTRSESPILTHRESAGLAVVLGVFLLLSTGTTGYGGLGVFVGVFFLAVLLFEQLRTRRLLRVVLAGIGVLLGILFVDAFVFGGSLQRVVQYQVQKITFDAGSGSIRLRYMLRTLDVFFARPLLGAGVGSHHVPSMLFTLLAEVGLLGVFVFSWIHVSVYRHCCWFVTETRPAYAGVALPLLIGGVTILLTNLVAKSISTLLFPWYWFSMALPLALVATWKADGQKDSNAKAIDFH